MSRYDGKGLLREESECNWFRVVSKMDLEEDTSKMYTSLENNI
jgi:hypothetical protein